MEKNPVDNEIFLTEGNSYMLSLVPAQHPKDSSFIVGILVLESSSSLVIRDEDGEEYLVYKSSIRYIQKLGD